MFIFSVYLNRVFSELFELVSLLSKQFYAFKAYILLLHVFSLRVTLTRVRVTQFTQSLINAKFFFADYTSYPIS